MNTNKTLKTASALMGLLALTAYILACAEFSPDDSKVLCPAFDPDSGALGMAVYDRVRRHSELRFVAPEIIEGTNAPKASYLRGAWLPDGHRVVIAYSLPQDNNDVVDFAVVPIDKPGPTKLFHVSGFKDAGNMFLWPLSIAGTQILLNTGSNEVVRLDLNTGAMVRHEFAEVTSDITVLPGADRGAFYLEAMKSSPTSSGVFGRLDPETFQRTPVMNLRYPESDNSTLAYTWDGKRLVLVQTNQLLVWSQGQPVLTRPLSGGKDEQLAFGSASFSVKGETVWATFQRKLAGKTRAAYGLMEIPVDVALPVRETILIADAPADKDPDATGFQGSLSHDGKTFAVDSTYLACQDQYEASDSALFLVSLTSPNRSVLRVPIPVPRRRPLLK